MHALCVLCSRHAFIDPAIRPPRRSRVTSLIGIMLSLFGPRLRAAVNSYFRSLPADQGTRRSLLRLLPTESDEHGCSGLHGIACLVATICTFHIFVLIVLLEVKSHRVC